MFRQVEKPSLPPDRADKTVAGFVSFAPEHYREMKRKNTVRLLITYIGPLLILIVYFFFQYDSLYNESRQLHLKAIAENQANTFDLFLSERLVNISNLIDDPKLDLPPSRPAMENYLDYLRRISEAFVDIGFFDSAGIQAAYAGPFPSLEKVNYSTEEWYLELKRRPKQYIISDIYLGFRRQPHFTIAVSRIIEDQYIALRATLEPDKIYEYIQSLEGANEVITSIVNHEGQYQVVTSHMVNPLTNAAFVPPRDVRHGVGEAKLEVAEVPYAYSWLKNADWALMVIWVNPQPGGFFAGHRPKLMIISLAMLLLGLLIVLYRARKVTDLYIESEQTRAQLEHASKLASVGELAAGIAHEINNPLAAINEEAGLMKDLIDPQFGRDLTRDEISRRLDSIQESVFRCRDITRKLLGFVRQTDFDLRRHDLHGLINDVVDGILGPGMVISNIEIVKKYNLEIPEFTTDGNQLRQVLLNLIMNGIDALEGIPGQIVITTGRVEHNLYVAVADTGKGISPENMDKIFLPFFTTKGVGKGTGLGLSVSYGIIKSLGGRIEVKSSPGKGSVFTITLPLD